MPYLEVKFWEADGDSDEILLGRYHIAPAVELQVVFDKGVSEDHFKTMVVGGDTEIDIVSADWSDLKLKLSSIKSLFHKRVPVYSRVDTSGFLVEKTAPNRIIFVSKEDREAFFYFDLRELCILMDTVRFVEAKSRRDYLAAFD